MKEQLTDKVVDWYKERYPQVQNNRPSAESYKAISLLVDTILLPVWSNFGEVHITYGFTSPQLLRSIQKQSPSGIAPSLDQHASCESRRSGKLISPRLGAAVDFKVTGYELRMDQIARWVHGNLPFDRMYFYGKSRPLHVSVGPEQSRFVQIMAESPSGKRYPSKRATGSLGIEIWDDLQ
ncbi:MAG: hypothetical protein OIF51_00070 [Cellvibrionaceae bacterium]|nr:hypothetical protein [Cellvibrionaceae bacterium]